METNNAFGRPAGQQHLAIFSTHNMGWIGRKGTRRLYPVVDVGILNRIETRRRLVFVPIMVRQRNRHDLGKRSPRSREWVELVPRLDQPEPEAIRQRRTLSGSWDGLNVGIEKHSVSRLYHAGAVCRGVKETRPNRSIPKASHVTYDPQGERC